MRMEAPMTQTCWVLFTVFLNGVLAGDWSVTLPTRPICALTGSTVHLPCSYEFPQSGAGVTSEMWCLGESRCITERYVYHSAGIFPEPSYQSRVEYLGKLGSKNCSLKISDLRQTDSGTYIFYLITNHTSEKMPAQSGVQLLVAGSSAEVTVLAGPSSDLTEGESVHLFCCSSTTSPDAQVTWYKTSSPVQRHLGPVWTISKAMSEDSGSYYCQTKTGDKIQNSTELVLDLQYPPRKTSVSVSSEETGRPVTLTCSSDANPPVLTYTWFKDASCDPTADTSFHKAIQSLATPTGRSQTLSSINVSADESKVHCCVARNRHGAQKFTVKLSQSSEPNPNSGGRMVLLGVTIAVLLAIVAIIIFIMKRRKTSSRHRSYVLTPTASSMP